jgi:hypothetical protein
VERIALAPRQSLALIEAEGRRFLVATSPEGAPAFYPLDGELRPAGARASAGPVRSPMYPAADKGSRTAVGARISW